MNYFIFFFFLWPFFTAARSTARAAARSSPLFACMARAPTVPAVAGKEGSPHPDLDPGSWARPWILGATLTTMNALALDLALTVTVTLTLT